MWNSNHDYQFVTSLPSDLGKRVSLDLEYLPSNKKKFHSFDSQVYCYSFSDRPGRSFIVMRDSSRVIQELIDSGRELIYWNFKGDHHVMANAGLVIPSTTIPLDGMLWRFLQDTNHSNSKKLKDVAKELFSIEHPDWSNEIYGSKQTLKLYAGGDAELHLMCYNELERTLSSTFSRQFEVESRMLMPLWNMERTGLLVDRDRLARFQVLATHAINKTREKIFKIVGYQFELDSPSQVSTALYDTLKIPSPEKRLKSGWWPTDKITLASREKAHPVVSLVLLYRRLTKRKGTYIDGLIDCIFPDGRVHTDLLQCVTPTKRLASTHPNLLNQPKRHKTAVEELLDIRSVFIPDLGFYFMKSDFSQIEFRLMIYSSGNPDLRRRMDEEKEDFHTTTARIISRDRNEGKTFNYALVYGADERSTQHRLQVSQQQARAVMQEFDCQYAGLRPWMEEEKRWSDTTGWSRTFMGKLRPLPDLKSTDRLLKSKARRNVINDQIQGGAAEIFKIANIRLYNRLKPGYKMCLPIHDEVLFQVDSSIPPQEAASWARDCMTIDLGKLGRYPVDISVGPLWSETYEPSCWDPQVGKLSPSCEVVKPDALEEEDE